MPYAVFSGLIQLYASAGMGAPAIGWAQGREAKEENPPLNLGSDEWVAVQDVSLLGVWGDAAAKKGNAFFPHIFTSKVSWVAAHPGLRLFVRLLKMLGGWRC